nr:unnamed protein product [Callosobruchus chinensis]
MWKKSMQNIISMKDQFKNTLKIAPHQWMFFLVFFSPVVNDLISQSNLYAVQKNKQLNLTKAELFFVFVEINQLMGYHKLPSWKDYWSTSKDLSVPFVSSKMRRDRFDMILSNLHANESRNKGSGCR